MSVVVCDTSPINYLIRVEEINLLPRLLRALHCVLTLRGKRKKDAPGAEWFLTTPEEVSELIQTVLGK